MALRDNPLGELKVPLAWTAGVALIVALVGIAIIVASGLFILWREHKNRKAQARIAFDRRDS